MKKSFEENNFKMEQIARKVFNAECDRYINYFKLRDVTIWIVLAAIGVFAGFFVINDYKKLKKEIQETVMNKAIEVAEKNFLPQYQNKLQETYRDLLIKKIIISNISNHSPKNLDDVYLTKDDQKIFSNILLKEHPQSSLFIDTLKVLNIISENQSNEIIQDSLDTFFQKNSLNENQESLSAVIEIAEKYNVKTDIKKIKEIFENEFFDEELRSAALSYYSFIRRDLAEPDLKLFALNKNNSIKLTALKCLCRIISKPKEVEEFIQAASRDNNMIYLSETLNFLGEGIILNNVNYCPSGFPERLTLFFKALDAFLAGLIKLYTYEYSFSYNNKNHLLIDYPQNGFIQIVGGKSIFDGSFLFNSNPMINSYCQNKTKNLDEFSKLIQKLTIYTDYKTYGDNYITPSFYLSIFLDGETKIVLENGSALSRKTMRLAHFNFKNSKIEVIYYSSPYSIEKSYLSKIDRPGDSFFSIQRLKENRF